VANVIARPGTVPLAHSGETNDYVTSAHACHGIRWQPDYGIVVSFRRLRGAFR
jgi:hypothetical protein